MKSRISSLNYRQVITVTCLLACALTLCACGGGDAAPEPPRFTSLGFVPGYASSQATAISGDGAVVAGTATAANGLTQAFRWTAQQGIGGLGFLPGGVRSSATAVSGDGSVVVGNADTTEEPSAATSAFRWRTGAGITRINPIVDASLCTASGVSTDGNTVAGTCLSVNNEAFRWTQNAGAIGLGRFGGGSNQTSSANAISANGAVIVGQGHPVLTGAVLWPAIGAGMIIGKLPGDDSAYASAVSRDGTVVVGTSIDSAQRPRAFRWTQANGIIPLASGLAGIIGSSATAVSGDGRTIVGWATTPTGDTAMMWDADHGLRSIEVVLFSDYNTVLNGWRLIHANAISDDGRTIAGYGTNPQGQTEGWVLKLPS